MFEFEIDAESLVACDVQSAQIFSKISLNFFY